MSGETIAETTLESFKELCKGLGGRLRRFREGLWSCFLAKSKFLEISTPPYGLVVEDTEKKKTYFFPLTKGSYKVNLVEPVRGEITVTKYELAKSVVEVKMFGKFSRIDFRSEKEYFNLIFR